jgi:hypothetical protein
MRKTMWAIWSIIGLVFLFAIWKNWGEPLPRDSSIYDNPDVSFRKATGSEKVYFMRVNKTGECYVVYKTLVPADRAACMSW